MVQAKTLAGWALAFGIVGTILGIIANGGGWQAYVNDQTTRTTLNQQPRQSSALYNMTFTGPCTTNYVQVLASHFGNVITVAIPYASCTGTAQEIFTGSVELGANYWPPADVCVQFPVTVMSSYSPGSALVNTTGGITIYGGAFCAASEYFADSDIDATGLTTGTTTSIITYTAVI